MVRAILLERNQLSGISRKNMLGLDFFVGLCFYVDSPEMPQRHSRIPAGDPPAVGPLPTATNKH